jgi:hypothetical protein
MARRKTPATPAHSPGPWQARRRAGAEYTSVMAGKESVGSAYGPNQAANAALMAAAPALLSVCRHMIDLLGEVRADGAVAVHLTQVLDAARDAVTHATTP